MSQSSVTRRELLLGASALTAGTIAGSGLAEGQNLPSAGIPSTAARLAPRAELVNVLEYEAEAARVLSPALQARITGSDRTAFDRITLRPRMNVPTVDLDLTVTLFGDAHFAPLLVGPIADQKAFHPEAEVAMIRGASAARAAVVVSSRSSTPLATLTTQAKSPLWIQVFAADPAAKEQIDAAAKAGCKVACVTLATAADGSVARLAAPTVAQWTAVQALAKASPIPVLVKGVASVDGAKRAVSAGAKGIIASSYGQPVVAADPLLFALPAIVAAAGTVPVLADGGFRRGTDIVKALAFGARAVLIGRPVMWGLAAYGADGVQGVMEMLQTETGRYMAMCGKPTLAALTPDMLKVHAARPASTAKPATSRERS